VPLLWRFHAVHHLDRDLDASTAIRFHFGEMLLSVPYRLAQVALLGISPTTLRLWKRLLFASVVFHHSNLRLPLAAERRLATVIVTPRMHGIHHSEVEAERNSNWSSLISWWDFAHRTFRADIPQNEITIGIGEPDTGLLALLEFPFRGRPRMTSPAFGIRPLGRAVWSPRPW
jgi:sterol desaturase/sphingolipid hydroxylase (fatty acid hydroxylase superfamily)